LVVYRSGEANFSDPYASLGLDERDGGSLPTRIFQNDEAFSGMSNDVMQRCLPELLQVACDGPAIAPISISLHDRRAERGHQGCVALRQARAGRVRLGGSDLRRRRIDLRGAESICAAVASN
jgi:hypothetical protein